MFCLASAGFAEVPTHESRRVFNYDKDGIQVTSNFQGGRLSDFYPQGESAFTAVISPEWRPMNNQQAWYSFRITAREKMHIRLNLTFTDGKQNLFYPKISRDRIHWENLPKSAFQSAKGDKGVWLELDVDQTPLWISAQELFTESDFDQWIAG